MDDDRSHDEGTACDLPPPSDDAELTRVGRDTPRRVRALGVDLILFRDGAGRPGLLTLCALSAARTSGSCSARWRRYRGLLATRDFGGPTMVLIGDVVALAVAQLPALGRAA
jgi:hypothetical protein